MPEYTVCIIPKGAARSTYHGRYLALTAADAADQYINNDPEGNTGARVAQRDGGTVIVTPWQISGSHAQWWGHELFEVAPGPEPVFVRPPRAHIVRQRVG